MSGAFGDIGVLVPIAIVLIAKNGFNPTALFLMAGLFYVLSAYYFRITMPVQPLKAMSAIAIVSGLGYGTMNAAGIIMGAILLLIAVTGLSVRLGKVFPVSVIRGIQLGLGIMLIRTSFSLMSKEIYIALLAGAILVAGLLMIKKIPPLLPVLMIGMIFSFKKMTLLTLGPLPLNPVIPGLDDLWSGFCILVLPQIALTFGNAIVATEATGKLLYGRKAERLDLKRIPMSMGIANVISGVFGGVPMCHGCGGLTAHCRFGARSERSGYIIGLTLVALALVFGSSALSIVSAFPVGILGTLLFYVGIQHSLFIRDIVADKISLLIAITVAASGFMTQNLTIGFLSGLAIHHGLSVMTKTKSYFAR
jgi:SulP family sulfate permease